MTERAPTPSIAVDAGLDPARLAALTAEGLLAMDDGELFLERVRGERLTFEDGRLKVASREMLQGFGFRAVAGERVGFATGDRLEEDAIRRAVATVQAVAGGHGGRENVAPAAPGAALYGAEDPIESAGRAEKLAVLERIEHYCRSQEPAVVSVTATLSASHQVIEIFRGDGRHVGDVRPLVRLDVSVVLERDGRRESASYGGGGRYPLARLLDESWWRSVADEALRQARVRLEAVPAPAGEMTVVLGAGWPGVMLHEAVGHGLEGDFNRKRTSAFAGLLGEMVAASGVTVVDDGTLPERRGSLTVDDEGTPSARTVLIENGRLVGYMQDRQNARLMRMRPTGNGRRQSYAHTVMPRMTNTYMLAGSQTREEIIRSVERGIYAVSFGGGQVDITSGRFVFQATEAYLIERGRIGAPVKGAMLIGNGPEAMRRITGIGDDLALDNGIGTCGKNGQGVPVGVGQPTVRIERVTVGGTA
ncbi:metalloprotease TldD [Benzoatithermus flavus]|uniref:Metalloprotease TldD n=1 Tax=Benzoatithermus flavus TaxID=3108223 RepID=A0ABU8XLZ5_9PROT